MSKQSFIKGTMILLAAGIINRLLGFVPRIMLPRIIGAEGVGLYQLGYPFLIVILTLISGGLPLAVAKLVAEAESEKDEPRVKNILKISLILTLSLGVVFTILCIWAAPWITTRLLTDSRVYYTFLSMSPIIIIVGISSVYRGYFQGRHDMIPTAASQIVETLVRIVAVLFLAYYMLPYGIEYAAAGAMLGVVLGEVGGLLVLFIHYYRNQPPIGLVPETVIGNTPGKLSLYTNFRKIMQIYLPVTASKLVGSGSYFLESIMIVQSLAIAGIAAVTATTQYGILQGMVIPILLLPSALTYSLSVSLIPFLSEAAARNDMKLIHKRLHQSLKLALVTGAPFAVIMFVLASPLCYFLYHDAEVGDMLRMMAPAALFIYFQGPLQAALQALNKPGTALLNTFIGACIKLLLIYLLATKPEFGIMGALIAINANIVLVTALHWNSLVQLFKFSMNVWDFIKVAASMVLMAAACHFIMVEPWISSLFLRFLASCMAGCLVYLLCITALKLIDKHDAAKIPWLGKKLTKFF
ncbi:MAG TPA: stage V sporulation protein B [Bacilli bacterium]